MRVKVLIDGVLKEHPGIFRPLEEFKLSKLEPLTTSVEDDQGILKEVVRVGKIIHKNTESIRDEGYSMNLINKYRGTSRYGNNKEKVNCDKKGTLYLKRLTNRTKVDRDRKIIETSESISSNSGKNTRTAKDSVNDYRGTRRHRNNKEKEHSEVKKEAVYPKRIDNNSTEFFSFEMKTSSSKNKELE